MRSAMEQSVFHQEDQERAAGFALSVPAMLIPSCAAILTAALSFPAKGSVGDDSLHPRLLSVAAKGRFWG